MTCPVFLCGEGSNELGTAAGQVDHGKPGVLHALLDRAKAGGWRCAGAALWKDKRLLVVTTKREDREEADARRLRKAAQLASEVGAQVLALLRDLDGDTKRRTALTRAANAAASEDLTVVAGFPDPDLDAWMARVAHPRHTGSPAQALRDKGITPKDTEAYVALVHAADALPEPMQRFVDDVRSALTR